LGEAVVITPRRELRRSIMIRDVVVYLSTAGSDAGSRYAISIASAFGAHIAGIAFAFEPVIPASVMGGISADLIEVQRKENETAAKSAMTGFEQAARLARVSVETRLVNASLTGAADMFARIARRFDLSIVTQAERDKMAPDELFAETALFNSGRPIIVVPYIQQTGLTLDRVIVCWDGSREATRAVGDAMPLLERAKSVDVLIVATDKAKRDANAGAGPSQHLARHGLKTEIKRVEAGDIDVTSAILSYVADNSADFIVMGGYGHSRLREFILGGVTRNMLAAMTVPTLMSH
jgi:nucleotide-binding universal stress UspA family protein